MALFGVLKPEIRGITAWINSKPLTLAELKGRVVLVDFWTYSCVNCQRTLPYIREWHSKYAKLGLVIIGVHTPEFEFEKKRDNVERAARDAGLEYAIAMDSDYATWQAFDNHYWPAKYLIDASGEIRYKHFGEGAYEETERAIRKLLEETGKDLSKTPIGSEKMPGYDRSMTPETYIGAARNTGIGSGAVCKPGGKCDTYIDPGAKDPSKHKRDVVYLAGQWEQKPEYAETFDDDPAYILIRYFAKEANLVIHPPEKPVTAKVFLDEKPLTAGAGEDVKNGELRIDQPRMYRIVKTNGYEEHQLKLLFNSKGVQCYAYTFG
jgi:thiol-disulfide isomerase/thioredoxin